MRSIGSSWRRAEQAAFKQESKWLAELPLLDMVRFGWVNDCHGSEAAQVAECLGFFGVASVPAWRERYGAPVAALSMLRGDHMQPGAVAAWLRQGERRAATIECTPFDRKAFVQVLKKLRAFPLGPAPEVFVPQMTDLCAAAGVAVVWEPTPQGCPARGAVQWLTPDRALLMLGVSYTSSAQFWYTFYHEAAHLLLHGKRAMFLEVEDRIDSAAEVEADAYARRFLREPRSQAR
ncbi:MAG: hypothetical protein IPK16_12705 [Anaerolineales bacterium]|nr:hypothetical protein [Anaerolineales bacterium]